MSVFIIHDCNSHPFEVRGRWGDVSLILMCIVNEVIGSYMWLWLTLIAVIEIETIGLFSQHMNILQRYSYMQHE